MEVVGADGQMYAVVVVPELGGMWAAREGRTIYVADTGVKERNLRRAWELAVKNSRMELLCRVTRA